MAKPKKTIKGVTCKKGYWYARVDGDLVYCGKGDKGFMLATAARMKWEVKQYENREINAGLKVKKVELIKVIDLSNWYMTLPMIQEQKIYQRKLFACANLMKYFGSKRVNQLEADDQERYRVHRKAQGAMDGTVDLEIQLLSAMYHLALKRKKINVDAMPGEFVKKGNFNPRRIVTELEFEKLLNHATPDFRDVLVCGYESAMRSSEICKLTAGQVHLDIQHISGAILDYIDLGIFDTKTGARRTIPVSAKLKKVFQRRTKDLNPDHYVFTNKGKRYYKALITTQMKATCEKAGIIYGDKPINEKGERIGIVFHCLRHSRTSKWVEAGFSDEIVRRATGHKSLEAYQQYIKLDPHVVMRLVENPKPDKNGGKSAQTL
jgi:integrase